MKPREPLGHVAHGERAGAVGAVAVEDAARVDGHEHPFSIGSSPGTACGDEPVAPAATTVGNETPSAPASRKLRSTHHARSRSLRPLKRSWRAPRRSRRRRARPAHRRDLLRVLHGPERLDEARRRHGVHARVDERPVAGIRQVRFLEGDRRPLRSPADRREEIPSRLDEPRRLRLSRPRARSESPRRASHSRPARRARLRSSSGAPSGSGRSPARRGRTADRRRASGSLRRAARALDPAQPRSFTRNSSASR